MVQDRVIVTTRHKSEVTFNLSNTVISDELEWFLTQMSIHLGPTYPPVVQCNVLNADARSLSDSRVPC